MERRYEDPAFPALLPPDEEITLSVSPCRRALRRILWGYALQAITLQFLYLHYLLPLCGMMLQLLGLRTLRRENPAFRGGYVLALLRTVLTCSVLLWNTTIWCHLPDGSIRNLALSAVSLLLQVTQLILFAAGLRQVQRKAGTTPRMGGAVGMVLWLLVLSLLAVIGYRGAVLSILMILAYGLLLRALFRVARDLDEAGYAVTAAPVRISDGALLGVLAAVLLAGAAVGYGCFGRYPMAWQPVTMEDTAELSAIRENLLALGFPEDILSDLSAEELLTLRDARRVVVSRVEHPVNDGRWVSERDEEGIHQYVVYDDRELLITGVGVELSGEREAWRIIHHFRWIMEPARIGTESIQLWTTDRLDGWRVADAVTGELLCDRADGVYRADYAELGRETYGYQDVLFGEQEGDDVFAAFSLPREGENIRGYLAYTAEEMEDGWIIDSWINYTHQRSRWQYPVLTAKGMRMRNGWRDAGAFLTVQDALQFYPNAAEPAPFS
ncbi:MAG: hypothetical protein E7458_05665 [Ruminococcaceae bacterium]|nr:hypothetical protein [Oscillospiraceae bacterium]